MKIIINENASLQEPEIIINCPRITSQLAAIISQLHVMDLKITGTENGQTYILDAADILFIDTADKRTFLYTQSNVYESSLRLYELEEKLYPSGFIRANKSCILNFNHIKSIKADIDGRLLITMNNSEKLFISRQYAPLLKKKLEGK